jgi:2-deoxy-D-gluconate 3-dehydrogenase
MHRFDLGGRVAIVTGGNRGIGSGIARGLLECGATLVITGRDAQRNEAMVVELAVFGRPVSAIAMDVSDPEQCRAAVAESVRRHGRLDILVNNAGIGGGGQLPHEIDLATWHRVIDTNLTSVMVLSQAAYPEMQKAGGGKIINVSSVGVELAGAALGTYSAGKAAMIAFTRSCSAAWAKDNIQVNAIMPGYVDTEMTQRRLQKIPEWHGPAIQRTAARRMGTPDDFAGIAAFLASAGSNFITGQAIVVDGGLLRGT